MTLQSVSVAQKLKQSGPSDPPNLVGGYADGNGTPNNALSGALTFVDNALGQMVTALAAQHLLDNTLYRLPVIPRCGRVGRQAHHVWGMDDAGIFLSQRTGGGRAAAFGTRRERACLPAGSDDRQPARGDGARGSGAAGGAEPVGGL